MFGMLGAVVIPHDRPDPSNPSSGPTMASASALAAPIPDGPDEEIFPTFEELFDTLAQRMAQDGYKPIKRRSRRRQLVNGEENGEPDILTRVDITCCRGQRTSESQSNGIRKRISKKIGCPWRAKAVYKAALDHYVLLIQCNEHNHPGETPEEQRKKRRQSKPTQKTPNTTSAFQGEEEGETMLPLAVDSIEELIYVTFRPDRGTELAS